MKESHAKIGQLTLERDFLESARFALKSPVKERIKMISKGRALSLRQQCLLLRMNRSRLYYEASLAVDDIVKTNLIGDVYQRYPMYGHRLIRRLLERISIALGRKKIRMKIKPLDVVKAGYQPKFMQRMNVIFVP